MKCTKLNFIRFENKILESYVFPKITKLNPTNIFKKLLFFSFFLILSTSQVKPEAVTIASILTFSKMAVNLIDGNPEREILAGNREILKGVTYKLNNMEDRLISIQQLIIDMPESISKILDVHEIKKLNQELQEIMQRIEFDRGELIRDIDAKIFLAWHKYYDKLIEVKKQLELILRKLKVQEYNNDMIAMLARSATYGMLIRVHEEIISINKKFLYFDENTVKMMGFYNDINERKKILEARQSYRHSLAASAYNDTKKSLEDPLFNEIKRRINELRLWQETNGYFHQIFPSFRSWILKFPSYQVAVETTRRNFNRIGRLLLRICPQKGLRKRLTSQEIERLLMRSYEPTPPRENAILYRKDLFKKIKNIVQNCRGGFGGDILDIKNWQSFPVTYQQPSEGDNPISWKHRTPLVEGNLKFKRYYNSVGFWKFWDKWIGNPYILQSPPNIYSIEQRQYEVERLIHVISRPKSTKSDVETRVEFRPGFMAPLSKRVHEELSEEFKSCNRSHDDQFYNQDVCGWSPIDEKRVWWDGRKGFEVSYLEAYDVRKQAKERTKEHMVDLSTVCFAPLRPSIRSSWNQIVLRLDRIKIDLPKATLVRGRGCVRDHIGIPFPKQWRRLHPERWVDFYNGHMAAIEFALHVQVTMEHNYLRFLKYFSRLKMGENPELGHIIDPRGVAELIAQQQNADQAIEMLELLAQNDRSKLTDKWISTTIKQTGERIEDEEQKAKFAANLKLFLFAAETASNIVDNSTTERTEVEEELGRVEEELGRVGEELGRVGEELGRVGEESAVIIEIENSKNIDTIVEDLTRLSPSLKGGATAIDEPGIKASTPLLNIFGAAKLGKTVTVIVVHRAKGISKTVARFWIKKVNEGKTILLARKIGTAGKGGVIKIPRMENIESLSRTSSGKIFEKLNQAINHGKSRVKFDNKLTFNQITQLGQKFLCGGQKGCVARTGRTKYGGVWMQHRNRKFRIGVKKAGLEANFENLKTGSNVHYRP